MAADLSLLFTLKAKNESASEMKAVEAQIARLKDRIKEIRTETDIPLKTERINALKPLLEQATARHKELTDATKLTAKAHEDLSGALSAVSPRLGGLVSSLSTAVGPLAAVAVGLAAIGGAAAALFEVTKGAAEFQGKLFDLSQQTGISVETLSTLEVIARQTGSSIEAITASLGIFQKNLEDAQDPTSKEATLLKNLGVETNNTEQALRQALTALNKMPEGFQQTAAALELFGRGGKALLAILKETNGDLDAATERLRAMGILITTDAAKAADKFNDQLAEVGFQLRAVTAIIGNEAMPVILDAVKTFSQALADNQDNLSRWTSELFDAAQGAIFLATHVSGLIPLLQDLAAVTPAKGTVLDLLFRATPIGGAISALADLERLRAGPFGDFKSGVEGEAPKTGGFRRPTGGGRGAGTRERDTALRDAIREAALAEREALILNSADVNENKRALEEQSRDIETFTKRAIELANLRHDAAIVRINEEQEALDQALAKKLIKQKEYDVQNRELTLRNTEAQQKNADEIFRLEQERDRKIAAAQQAARQREEQIAQEADERIIARIRNRIGQQLALETDAVTESLRIHLQAIDREKEAINARLEAAASLDPRERAQQEKELNAEYRRLASERASIEVELNRRLKELGEGRIFTESDAEKQIAVIIDEGFKRRRAALEEEADAYTTTLERRESITAELIRLDGERAFSAEEAARRIIKAQFDEQNAAAEGATRKRRSTDPDIIPPSIEGRDAFEVFRESIEENLGGDAQTAALAGLDVLQQSFHGIAQAVGEAVQAFVLFGGAGQGLKKFTAVLISEIAKMAAVQAIWELAQGIAMLALNFFWPDPRYAASATAHFHAAAIYGGLAAVAAVAGRAVAGGSFQQAGGGGGSGTGTAEGTRNPSDQSTGPGQTPAVAQGPIDIDRTPGAPRPAEVLEFRVKGDVLIDTFERDYMLNGRTRIVIRSDGQS